VEWAGSLYFQMFGLTMQRLPRPVLMHSILRPASFSYARSTLQCLSSMGIINQARRICQTEHPPCLQLPSYHSASALLSNHRTSHDRMAAVPTAWGGLQGIRWHSADDQPPCPTTLFILERKSMPRWRSKWASLSLHRHEVAELGSLDPSVANSCV
jgi:hypothetical protein